MVKRKATHSEVRGSVPLVNDVTAGGISRSPQPRIDIPCGQERREYEITLILTSHATCYRGSPGLPSGNEEIVMLKCTRKLVIAVVGTVFTSEPKSRLETDCLQTKEFFTLFNSLSIYRKISWDSRIEHESDESK